MAILGKTIIGWLVWEYGSNIFDIRNFRGTKCFFYVIGNGVNDSFNVENRAGREFIGTGRWKEILRLRKMGRGQFLSVMGGEGKSFLLLLFSHSSLYI